jgi:hypothetical protein
MGTLTAVVLAVFTALTVAAIPDDGRWQFALTFSPQGVELSATTEGARIALML